MAQKIKSKGRKLGSNTVEKKEMMNPKLRSFISTTITIIVLLIFFIINNTREEPKSGPYPPFYNAEKNNAAKVDSVKGTKPDTLKKALPDVHKK